MPSFLVAYVPALLLVSLIQRFFYGAAPYPPQVSSVHLPVRAGLYGTTV